MAIPVGGGWVEKAGVAEALRRRADKYGATPSQGTTINTAASGAFPGMTQVDWGGIMGNALNSYQTASSDKEATAAESESSAAQQAALAQMMSEVEGGSLTMDQAINLQQLTGQDYTGMVQKPAAAGAVLQSLGEVPPYITAKVRQGEPLTQEDYTAIEEYRVKLSADKNTREAELHRLNAEADAANRAPPKPIKPTNSLEQLKAQYTTQVMSGDQAGADQTAKFIQDLVVASTPPKAASGAGGKGGRFNQARQMKTLRGAIDSLTELISKEGDEMFSLGQAGSKGLQEYGENNPGSILGQTASAFGTKYEHPSNTKMRAMGIESALEEVAKMAPASDADMRMLLKKAPNAYQSKEGALAFIEHAERLYQNVMGGEYDGDVPTSPPPGSGGAVSTLGYRIPDGWDAEDFEYLTKEEQESLANGQ